MDTLLIGACCACMVRDEALRGPLLQRAKYLWIAPFVILPVVKAVSNLAGPARLGKVSFGYTAVALSYAALLVSLVATLGENTPVQAFFTNSVMKTLGKLSYSAYVWHQLVKHLIDLWEKNIAHVTLPWIAAIPIMFGATMLVSACSYAIVGGPF